MKTSENIKALATAMTKAQENIKGIKPDADNPFFKSNYITLDNILEVVRPILTNEDIWITQNISSNGEYVEVTTRLIHITGEWLETDILRMKPTKMDPQQLGSCITYAKRYQLSGLLGISSDVDDDGNKATFGTDKPKTITLDQANKLRTLTKEKKVSEEYICKFRKVSRFEELKEHDYQQVMEWLMKR